MCETESNLKNKVCSKLLNVIRFSFNNKDKIIMLAASATLVYYSVATIRDVILLFDNVKCTYYETCKNFDYISDFLRGVKFRCPECSKGYRYHKCFRNHKSQHEISQYLDNLHLNKK